MSVSHFSVSDFHIFSLFQFCLKRSEKRKFVVREFRVLFSSSCSSFLSQFSILRLIQRRYIISHVRFTVFALATLFRRSRHLLLYVFFLRYNFVFVFFSLVFFFSFFIHWVCRSLVRAFRSVFFALFFSLCFDASAKVFFMAFHGVAHLFIHLPLSRRTLGAQSDVLVFSFLLSAADITKVGKKWCKKLNFWHSFLSALTEAV